MAQDAPPGGGGIDELAVRHLEMVQQIIVRMASNSFLLKGWSVTAVTGLLAVLAKIDAGGSAALLVLLPALSFWGLDAYYLRQERLFRRLYEGLCAGGSGGPPFSMNTAAYTTSVASWFATLWTPSVAWLHGAVIVAVVTAWLWLV